jgi:hypothetical protein
MPVFLAAAGICAKTLTGGDPGRREPRAAVGRRYCLAGRACKVGTGTVAAPELHPSRDIP